jgi:hypothetical protein
VGISLSSDVLWIIPTVSAAVSAAAAVTAATVTAAG